ncbi:Gp49 family protein [Pseudoxanthomonas sp. 22568]|uniref:Gp49 family protein n=1 Tax=Pseudoxanthomonas sp. 22568 TaxID=3453945 RepID=UPI003F855E7A
MGNASSKVSDEDIDDTIVEEYYHVPPGSTLTICVLTLRNGHRVVGTSACIDPARFDIGLGQHYARVNARRTIWDLEGYARREQLRVAAQRDAAT